MSEDKLAARSDIDAAQITLDTFELSTSEISCEPAASLLAQYANPVAGDGLVVTSVEEPLDCYRAEAVSEQAVSEQPVSEQPVSEQPASEQPASEQPASEQPASVQPASVQPVSEQPVSEQPASEQPVSEQPVSEQPVSEQPVSEQPVSEQPVSEQPVSEQPVSEQPVSEQPVSEQPVSEQPVSEQPVSEQPASEQPVSEQPVSEQPVSEKPVSEQPVSKRPAKTKSAKGDAAESPVVSSSEPSFQDLPLLESVQEAVLNLGYAKPTEVQSQIIPHMLAGRDVLAQSQTGTGKTAAFALPILSRIDTSKGTPQVLVLAPTRELAIQVAKAFSTYGANVRDFRVVAIYGGQDYEAQFRALRRGVQVVVGTPGRVIDHVNRGSLDLSAIECLVLDEADEMLNMGFLEDVQFVLDRTPEQRQIALFSATLPAPIRSIAQRYLNDPAKITIQTKTMTADSIRQRAVFVTVRDKIDVLTRILEIEETDGVIVFTKTREATVTVAEQLTRAGLSAVALNGDMPQKVRERTIDQLKAGHLDVLVATDVAARGLDVSRISHVFNYDLPHDSESYIHRIGRTGRAGRKGEAIIFLSGTQRGRLKMIERTTKQPIEIMQAPTADQVNASRAARFKERITAITADKDLTVFKQIIAEYAEETGKPMELIAAALAEIAQQGRPFLMKEQPKGKQRDRDDRGESHRGQERGHHGGGDFSHRPERTGRAEGRRLGPPVAGMTRYRIEVGGRDGVSPGNIVGAIANEAGIQGDFIGPISIQDAFSTVDLPEGMPREIYQTLRNTWVSGKQLRIRYLAADDAEQRPHSNGSHHAAKPHRAKSGSTKPFVHGKAPLAAKKKKRKAKA